MFGVQLYWKAPVTHTHLLKHTLTNTYAPHLLRHPTPLSRRREGPHPKRKNGSNSTADRKNTEQRGKSGGTDVNFCHTIPTPTTFSPCCYCGWWRGGGCFDCCQRNQFSFHALASNCSESLFGSVDTKWLHSAAIPLSLTHVSRLLQVVSTSNSVFNQARQTSSCREHHHMAEETGIYSRAQLNKMICAVFPPFYHKKKSGKSMR